MRVVDWLIVSSSLERVWVYLVSQSLLPFLIFFFANDLNDLNRIECMLAQKT